MNIRIYACFLFCLFAGCTDPAPKEDVNPPPFRIPDQGSNAVVKGFYSCVRLGHTANEMASDLHIVSDEDYEVDDSYGKYRYNDNSGVIEWLSGPLHQPAQDWIGIFTKKDAKTSDGRELKNSMIEIRRKSDIDEGNKRVLQQCDCRNGR